MSDKKSNPSFFLDRGEYLVEQFIKLQDSSDVKKMEKLKEELEEYISQFSDKKFENILHLIKAFINYNKTDDIPSSYELILPLLTNLEFGKNEEYFNRYPNIILLSRSISMCKDYKQAFEILELIEQAAEKYYSNESRQIKIVATAYSSFTENLLNFKKNNPLGEAEQAEIKDKFDEYSRKVMDICYKNKWNSFYATNLFRKGLFYDDKDLQFASIMLLEEINKPELQKSMNKLSDYDLALPWMY